MLGFQFVQLRNEARSAGIPVARVIQRIQIDADNGNEISLEDDTGSASGSIRRIDLGTSSSLTEANEAENGNDEKTEEQSIIHRLFQPSTSVLRASSTVQRQRSTENLEAVVNSIAQGEHPGGNDDGEEELEPWNYPISTFDTLNSEERQYVRYKSKQIGSTIERDDHFFDSSVFLDCVAQAERSRRLTVRAVDQLSQQHHRDENGEVSSSEGGQRVLASSQSTPSLPTSLAASMLVDSMNAKFTKQLDHATYEVSTVTILQADNFEIGFWWY